MASLRVKLLAVGLVIIVIAAAAFIVTSPNGQTTDKIKIGVLPVIDTLPLYAAQERGLFEQAGLNVELVQFGSALERDSAMTAGSIDGYFGDMVNTILLKSSGQDVKVITIDYHSNPQARMFGLLASPDNNISDINATVGMEVATSSGTVTEYVLDDILAEKNMTGKIGKFELKAIPMRYQSLVQNNVDLAILPEPYATQAILAGAHLVADDRTINITATVIGMKAGFITDHIEDVKKLLTVYNSTVQSVNQDPTRYYDVLEKDIGFPKALEGNFTFPVLSSTSLPTLQEFQKVYDWIAGKVILQNAVVYDTIVARELYP
ncbi:MAG TPA: ABC transporter substrate-binding protein [Methanomassiliicoccales archaeon]|jgi:NitT/TauT family transport system substrate-binding protein